MEALIVANIAIYLWGLYETGRRIKRNSASLWLRIPAAFICGYVALVYIAALTGIISQDEIPVFMRWFHIVIAGYIILEAKHG